jgi:hypothetical protein
MSTAKVIYNMINLILNLLLSPAYLLLIRLLYCTDFKLTVCCCLAAKQISLPVWLLQAYRVIRTDSPLIHHWPLPWNLEKGRTISGTTASTPSRGYWSLAWAWWVCRTIHTTMEEKTTVDGVFRVLIGSWKEGLYCLNSFKITVCSQRVVWIIWDFGGIVWIITVLFKCRYYLDMSEWWSRKLAPRKRASKSGHEIRWMIVSDCFNACAGVSNNIKY